LRWTGNEHRALVPEVEHELQLAELDAVETAHPTPGALDVIRYAPELGLAIVSNNSSRAIVRYFERHCPDDWPSPHPLFPIVGRDPADPSLMKPHPGPVLAGARATATDRPTAYLWAIR
jgi:beta-phosphoglucomutase-like phosphatase (HAD superfamily)